MYSQCPHCLTIYRLSLRELAQRRGQVTCGSCDQHFDALATLTAQLPPEPIEHLDVIPLEVLPPVVRQAVLRPRTPQGSLFGNQDQSPAASPANRSAPTPQFLRRHRPGQRSSWGSARAQWALAMVLSLSLLAQIAYAERDRLLAIPTYRAWAVQGCSLLGCQIGQPASVEDMALVSRDVRKHPNVADALLINAIISNRSDQPEPFPVLELRLSDLEQRVLAMRRFLPRDYLSDADRAEQRMAANSSLPVEFEVVDPGAEAVNFEFRLLPP